MPYYKAKFRDTFIFKEALESSCKQLKRFFKNNGILCELHGITLREQLNDMNSKGLNMSFNTIRHLKCGTNKTAALVYLNLFAVYWGIDASYLLYRDISKSRVIKYVYSPLCSYNIKTNI